MKGLLRGHNDTPFGRPTTGRPHGRPGVGHPQGVFGVFSYYLLVILFFNMVCLTVATARREIGHDGESGGCGLGEQKMAVLDLEDEDECTEDQN
jgi:hypothetical protein